MSSWRSAPNNTASAEELSGPGSLPWPPRAQPLSPLPPRAPAPAHPCSLRGWAGREASIAASHAADLLAFSVCCLWAFGARFLLLKSLTPAKMCLALSSHRRASLWIFGPRQDATSDFPPEVIALFPTASTPLAECKISLICWVQCIALVWLCPCPLEEELVQDIVTRNAFCSVRDFPVQCPCRTTLALSYSPRNPQQRSVMCH